jgi:hypothetical protein
MSVAIGADMFQRLQAYMREVGLCVVHQLAIKYRDNILLVVTPDLETPQITHTPTLVANPPPPPPELLKWIGVDSIPTALKLYTYFFRSVIHPALVNDFAARIYLYEGVVVTGMQLPDRPGYFTTDVSFRSRVISRGKIWQPPPFVDN